MAGVLADRSGHCPTDAPAAWPCPPPVNLLSCGLPRPTSRLEASAGQPPVLGPPPANVVSWGLPLATSCLAACHGLTDKPATGPRWRRPTHLPTILPEHLPESEAPRRPVFTLHCPVFYGHRAIIPSGRNSPGGCVAIVPHSTIAPCSRRIPSPLPSLPPARTSGERPPTRRAARHNARHDPEGQT